MKRSRLVMPATLFPSRGISRKLVIGRIAAKDYQDQRREGSLILPKFSAPPKNL